MSGNLPKYQANYSSIVAYVNRDQLEEQGTTLDDGSSSLFVNRATTGRSRNMCKGDIAFKWMPRYGNRAYSSGNVEHYDQFVTTLTGLKRLPHGEMQDGIEEVQKACQLSEDQLRLSLLSNMQILGFVVDDFDMEAACSKASVDIGIQITGIHTIHTYEDIHTGAHIRAVVPKSALFHDLSVWKTGRHAADKGMITLIPTAATEYDIVTYVSLIMSEYMHRNGSDSLAFVRTQRSHNMFENLRGSFHELVLTSAIMGIVAFAEHGLVSIPMPVSEDPLAVGVAGMTDEVAEARFGKNLRGNAGCVYYDRDANDETKLARPAPGSDPEFLSWTPSDWGVFLGIITGLLDEPGRANGPTETPNNVGSAVYRARTVSSSRLFEKEMSLVHRAVRRLLAMITATNGDHGDGVQEEFGAGQFDNDTHQARELGNGMGDSPILDNMYGKMLRQQYHAAPSFLLNIGNIVSFNLSTYLGTCIRGAEAGNEMSLYIRA